MKLNTVRALVMLGSVLVGMPVGSFYSWSVFINPIRLARPGFSPTASVHANSVVIAALAVACSVAGKILDNGGCFGVRALSATGSLVSAVGVGLCGLGVMYDMEWLLYVGGFLNGFGMGGAYVCFIKAFKTAWSHTKGFAAGWVMMVSSAGSFVFVWVCQAMLAGFAQSLPGDPVLAPALTFFVLAGILLVMQFFGSFLLLPPPVAVDGDASLSSSRSKELARPIVDTQGGDGGDGGGGGDDEVGAPPAMNAAAGAGDGDGKAVMTTAAVFSSAQFWLVLVVFFANLFPMLGVLSILASYLQSRFPGTSAQEAANILALVNIVGTVMRLFVGFLAGCVNSFLLFAIALGVQTALWVVLFVVTNSAALTLWEFAAVCIACKICYGSGFTLVNLLVDQVFGAKNGTQVYGLMIFALMGAALAAPNVVAVWYHGCSDLFPCNGTTLSSASAHSDSTSAAGGGNALGLGNATSGVDNISDYFAVSFGVTCAGGLALLALFITRRREVHNGE